MSDDSKKSMDDVLASIRRIVRAERNPQADEVPVDMQPAPDPEPAPVEEADKPADAPLELTPDMRMADATAGEEAPVAADFVMTPPVAPTPAAPSPDLDPDMIRDMVRDVVKEEMASNDLPGLIKSVIKDELTTGEIGGNISRNVLRMIKSEVAKATGG